MKLDVKSLIVGAMLVVALWAALSGSPSEAQRTYMGDANDPACDLEIGPQGEIYVMYTVNGHTRRVFKQDGQWACEVVAPPMQEYRNNVVTTPQARPGR